MTRNINITRLRTNTSHTIKRWSGWYLSPPLSLQSPMISYSAGRRSTCTIAVSASHPSSWPSTATSRVSTTNVRVNLGNRRNFVNSRVWGRDRAMTIGRWFKGQRQHVPFFVLPSHGHHPCYHQNQLKALKRQRQDLEQKNLGNIANISAVPALRFKILPALLHSLWKSMGKIWNLHIFIYIYIRIYM